MIARQNPYYSASRSAGPIPPFTQSLVQLDVVNIPSSTVELTPSHRPFPCFQLFSCQQVNETLHGFIARSAKKCEEMDQARCQNRERANASRQLSGQAGAHVFIWKNVDGYLIRKKLDRKEVDCDWGDYTNGQRRYNTYFNEWDLAKKLALEEDTVADNDNDLDQKMYNTYMGIDDPSTTMLPGPAMDTLPDFPFLSSPALPPISPTLTPQMLPPPNYSGVLDQVYDPPTPITLLKRLEPIEAVVYNCYGFTWHDWPTPYHRMATLCWEKTQKVVCDSGSKWNPIVKGLEDPFSDFVQCFLNKTILVPPVLWDLSTTNNEYVFSKGHKGLDC